LLQSPYRDEVLVMYAVAGLQLDADLIALAITPRLGPDANAVQYLTQNITLDGRLQVPVMTLHTTADGNLGVVEVERAYASLVNRAGSGEMLRQAFVHRAGHCTFTPAEMVSALTMLVSRLDRGQWGNVDPWVLNLTAAGLGSTFNAIQVAPDAWFPFGPNFVEYSPHRYPRSFDTPPAADVPSFAPTTIKAVPAGRR
jgi:hypothetical protein